MIYKTTVINWASGGIGIRAGLRNQVPQGLRVRVSSCPPKIMKVEVKSKKGLRTILSVIVDKKNIQAKMDERLKELQKEVALKGFRPGKVPPEVIKSQFGKSIYGEVVDKILRDTTTQAIDEKKLKIAGQPKLILNSLVKEKI